LKKSAGLFCFSILFQIASGAQSTPKSIPQDPPVKSAEASVTSVMNDAIFEMSLPDADATKSMEGANIGTIAIPQPKISPKNPPIRYQYIPRYIPREGGKNVRPFTIPEISMLGEVKSFTATAYALRGQTASGSYVRRGVIAADPRVLPLGSVVQIHAGNYSGVYSVQDTGRLVKGKIVDLWVPSYDEAIQFGRRNVRLQILRWGPAKNQDTP
jgi:3D (Asp-Asp-Asp) domain-containing protein